MICLNGIVIFGVQLKQIVCENISVEGNRNRERFHEEYFDFSNPEFFKQIGELGERYSKSTELKNMNGNRGSKHFIYINRTFFGLYNLMFDLKAQNVKINNFQKLNQLSA